MKQFAKLQEYSDDELIMIIYDEKEHWQKEAITYAKKILFNRGVTEEYSVERIKEIRKEIAILWEQELNERRTESYGIITLIYMALFWFKFILWDWYLKRNGYHKMRNQRLIAISIGILIYFLFGFQDVLTSDERELERIVEIDRIATQDSIAISLIDWSGTYIFRDSSIQSNKKTLWKLDLIHSKGKHRGTLIIGSENIINCIGLVQDDLIEFYPDTTYNLKIGGKLTYYDRMFTFGRDSFKIFTKWGKMNPYYSEKRRIENYFEIKNSM